MIAGFGQAASAQLVIGAPAALNSNAILDNDLDTFPAIATDRGGVWISVWQAPANDTTIDCSGASSGTCGTDSEILYAVSTDSGASWSTAQFLNTDAESDSASDVTPEIATDRNGHWVVVWSRNDEAAVSVSTNNGNSWSAPQVLSSVDLPFNFVLEKIDLATDRGGVWILAWSSNTQGTGPDFDIFVTRSLDNGGTWSAPIAVNPPDNPVYDDQEPAIASDGLGNWIVAWETDNQDAGKGADLDILASTSTDSGLTWSTPVAVNDDASTDDSLNAQDRTPDIATDSRGNWVIVWLESADSASPTGLDDDILWSRSVNLGASWSAAQAVDPNAAADTRFEYNPIIETDGHGKWVAAWEAFPALADRDLLIATSVSDGTAWGNLQVLNTQALSDSGDDSLVAMAADDQGSWVAVWNSDDTLGGTIFADTDILVADLVFLGWIYPLNDLSINAFGVVPGAAEVSFYGAATDGESTCGLGGEGDVWYRFQLPGTGVLSVDTCGSFDAAGVDTVVSIHGDAPGTTANEFACNDDWDVGSPRPCSGARDSSVEAAVGSAPVWIRVARYPGSAEGTFALNIGYVPEPAGLVLLGSGVLGLAVLGRARRSGRRRGLRGRAERMDARDSPSKLVANRIRREALGL